MANLHTDLQDGLFLRLLVVHLTGHHIPVSHTTFPMTLTEKMENINVVFSVLAKEGLKVVHHDNGKYTRTSL